MDELQNHYSAKEDYKANHIDYLLPEWITNLKNYFEKPLETKYSAEYN